MKEKEQKRKKEREIMEIAPLRQKGAGKKEREKLLKMLRNGRLITSCSQNRYFKV